MLKKQLNIYNFLKFLKDILRFFWKIFKILSKLLLKFLGKFRKFSKYIYLGFWGVEAPEAS